jgi:hypothetical protein
VAPKTASNGMKAYRFHGRFVETTKKSCGNSGRQKMAFVSHDDPLGSYTGTPQEVTEQPVQDADDL